MGFEWDTKKNQRNITKHGIDFSDAIEVFANPVVVRPDDRQNYGEDRWIALGKMRGVAVVLVYTKRKKNIRIISVGKANKNERRIYEEKIKRD